MRYDLHIHSKYSHKCGTLDPKDIIKYAMKKGLDGIAITDHNTIKGGLETKKYEDDSIDVIVGCELDTSQGEIIGLFIEEEIKSTDVMDIIDEIHSQGGLVVIPHPFDKFRKHFNKLEDYIGKIDAIEGFNARCIFNEDNRNARKFAREQNIQIVAGSDAHYGNEIGSAGIYVSNNIKDEILNGDIKLFCGKSLPPLNHLRTKIHKIIKNW